MRPLGLSSARQRVFHADAGLRRVDLTIRFGLCLSSDILQRFPTSECSFDR